MGPHSSWEQRSGVAQLGLGSTRPQGRAGPGSWSDRAEHQASLGLAGAGPRCAGVAMDRGRAVSQLAARIMIPEASLRGLVWTAEQLGQGHGEAFHLDGLPGEQTCLQFGNKGFRSSGCLMLPGGVGAGRGSPGWPVPLLCLGPPAGDWSHSRPSVSLMLLTESQGPVWRPKHTCRQENN